MLLPFALFIAIPVVWWWTMKNFDGTGALVMSTGVSVFALGAAYRMLGSMDLIPDWIPILGALDDYVAWLVMLGGAAIAAAGYYLF